MQARNADQVRQPQRAECLPQGRPQRRLLSNTQSTHQPYAVRKFRIFVPYSLPTPAYRITHISQTETATLPHEFPVAPQSTHAIDTIGQSPCFTIQTAHIHFTDHRLYPRRYRPPTAYRPITPLIIRQHQIKCLPLFIPSPCRKLHTPSIITRHICHFNRQNFSRCLPHRPLTSQNQPGPPHPKRHAHADGQHQPSHSKSSTQRKRANDHRQPNPP